MNYFWCQKTRDTGLPDGEDRIPLRSLVLTQYQSVTDRRTDGFAVAYTALAKLALRSAVTKHYIHPKYKKINRTALANKTSCIPVW